MADKTIPQLTEITDVDGNALVVVDNGTQTFKIQLENLAASLAPYGQPQSTVNVGASPVAVATPKVYNVQTSTGAISLQLPAVSGLVEGARFIVKDVSGLAATYPITLLRNATEQLEGVSASYVMETPYGSWTWNFDGANWWLV